jgi:hypothetical protein
MSSFQQLIKLSSNCSTLLVTSFKFKSNLLVKGVFLCYAAFAIVILILISLAHVSSIVMTLPKYLKCSSSLGCFWSIIIVFGMSVSWFWSP